MGVKGIFVAAGVAFGAAAVLAPAAFADDGQTKDAVENCPPSNADPFCGLADSVVHTDLSQWAADNVMDVYSITDPAFKNVQAYQFNLPDMPENKGDWKKVIRDHYATYYAAIIGAQDGENYELFSAAANDRSGNSDLAFQEAIINHPVVVQKYDSDYFYHAALQYASITGQSLTNRQEEILRSSISEEQLTEFRGYVSRADFYAALGDLSSAMPDMMQLYKLLEEAIENAASHKHAAAPTAPHALRCG